MSKDPSRESNSSPDEKTLIERMVERENMTKSYIRVKANKGAPGVDGMTVDELMPFLHSNWEEVKRELLEGKYKPKPVKRVRIPKSGGGTRNLGVPTVLDRLIQQALLQVLSPIFDPAFSENSYGFRKGRSAHQAILQAKKYQAEGKGWVVDLDIEKFFDHVNHDILMARVGKRMKDPMVRKLVRSYLNAGIMDEGLVSPTNLGTPQGGPLSPLLSNILLDDLDKELERRNHDFCRYADDCNIYVNSQKAGERVLESISSFLARKLKLKVNREKSNVGRPSKRVFLGCSFTGGQNSKIRVPKETVKKLRKKLKAVFSKGRGRNLKAFITEDLNPILRGWINYFRLAETKEFTKDLDMWVRRRLRLILWKQWKRNWTRRKRLIEAGLAEERAGRSAFNRRGSWWNSGASHMNDAFRKNYFRALDLVFMFEKLLEFRTVSFGNRLGT